MVQNERLQTKRVTTLTVGELGTVGAWTPDCCEQKHLGCAGACVSSGL